jgi:putative endonuclease
VGLRDFARQAHTTGRGRVAEEAAVRWLLAHGYRVVERNHRNAGGEIDVVAWEGETLCFVEVKARADTRHGPAVSAVGWDKRRRLARAAAMYLALRRLEPACRFDVLAVEGGGEGWQITLFRNAFTADR